MAIDFTTDPGGLFPRIGKILKIANLLTPYEASLVTPFDEIDEQYQATLLAIGGAVSTAADSLTRTASGVMSFASQAAENTVIQMVRDDQPSQSRSLKAAMLEVVRQMIAQSVTVEANVIGTLATPLAGSVGSGVLLTSTKRGDGLVQENSIDETLRLVCTADSYTGGAVVGQETFGLSGAPITYNSVWDYDYPTGSGASLQTRAISASQDGATSGNLLTNGDLESWTSDATPELENWTTADTWGTDLQQNSTNQLQGSFCLQFLPGTAANTTIYQEFGNATTGTSPTPSGVYSYGVNLWLRKVSGTITAGELRVALVDDAGNVLNDEQGVANSFTVDLTAITTSYAAVNAVFRLNNTPPDTIRLQLRLTTALTGASFVVDDICMAPMTAMYTGGPSFAVFSGATPFVGGDGFAIRFTNNHGGASNLATFQTGFARLFPMAQMGILLPSDTPGTVPNTLITA